ncbi:MAG: hypothetical protein IPL61_13040 [Myxococcales bacterium]|nr:hypothetical protein [Myxococcales bacterium]
MTFDGAACIGLRWQAGAPFGIETGESHVCEVQGSGMQIELPTPGRFAGIWRGASGELHVVHEGGVIYSRLTPDAKWTLQEVEGTLAGVWGLDGAGLVYAWGFAPGGRDAAVFLRDARGRWNAVAAPEVPILEMHGVRPDLIVGVGLEGAIFFLENGRWRRVASPVNAALASVCVVSDDEMYACGPGSRYLLEGSVHGWARRGPFDRTLYRVAKHRDILWVGCGASGLYRLAPGAVELELCTSKLDASHFDARGELLISGDVGLAGTTLADEFDFHPLTTYAELSAMDPPTWEAMSEGAIIRRSAW